MWVKYTADEVPPSDTTYGRFVPCFVAGAGMKDIAIWDCYKGKFRRPLAGMPTAKIEYYMVLAIPAYPGEAPVLPLDSTIENAAIWLASQMIQFAGAGDTSWTGAYADSVAFIRAILQYIISCHVDKLNSSSNPRVSPPSVN